MCLSFYEIGHAKAEQEINSNEANPLLSIDSEIKPFTTKVPAHVLESLDIVANATGMSRNAFVTKLIEVYLPQAFTEHSLGYARVFTHPDKTDEQLVLEDLEQVQARFEASPEACKYLDTILLKHLMDN